MKNWLRTLLETLIRRLLILYSRIDRLPHDEPEGQVLESLLRDDGHSESEPDASTHGKS